MSEYAARSCTVLSRPDVLPEYLFRLNAAAMAACSDVVTYRTARAQSGTPSRSIRRRLLGWGPALCARQRANMMLHARAARAHAPHEIIQVQVCLCSSGTRPGCPCCQVSALAGTRASGNPKTAESRVRQERTQATQTRTYHSSQKQLPAADLSKSARRAAHRQGLWQW